MEKKNRLPFLVQVMPVSLSMILFVTIPLIFIIIVSFMTRGTFGGIVNEPTLESYASLRDPVYWNVIMKSFKVATLTTILCLVFGYPFAYFIARKPPEIASKLILLLMIPFWTNGMIRLNSIMLFFQTNGPVNHILVNILNVVDKPVMFLYTDWLVGLGLFISMLPFAVLPMYSSIEKLEGSLLEASYDLGANPLSTFFKVTLPLTLPGIVSAIVLTFIPSLGIYTVTDILGGGKVMYIGNIIKNQFCSIRNWPLGAALSVLLMIITALILFIYSRVAKVEDMEVL